MNRLYLDDLTPAEMYEVTRGNWALSKRRNGAEYAFTVYKGIIKQVYRIDDWFPAKARDAEQKIQDRWRFNGEVAKDLQHYVGCSIKHYFKKGHRVPCCTSTADIPLLQPGGDASKSPVRVDRADKHIDPRRADPRATHTRLNPAPGAVHSPIIELAQPALCSA